MIKVNKASGTMEIEHDMRIVENLLAEGGLHRDGSKGTEAPTHKTSAQEEEDGLLEPLVGAGEISKYRSTVMKIACISWDRPDISWNIWQLARKANAPTKLDNCKLKKILRYLLKAPCVVQTFKPQDLGPGNPIKVITDADHAGDVLTRRSTTGVIILHGSNMIKFISVSQQTVALSSGESEFYAMATACSDGYG